jgi:hypothetical protein
MIDRRAGKVRSTVQSATSGDLGITSRNCPNLNMVRPGLGAGQCQESGYSAGVRHTAAARPAFAAASPPFCTQHTGANSLVDSGHHSSAFKRGSASGGQTGHSHWPMGDSQQIHVSPSPASSLDHSRLPPHLSIPGTFRSAARPSAAGRDSTLAPDTLFPSPLNPMTRRTSTAALARNNHSLPHLSPRMSTVSSSAATRQNGFYLIPPGRHERPND